MAGRECLSVDFAPAVIDEVVVVLHDLLEFLDVHRFPYQFRVLLDALHFGLFATTVQ